MYCRNACDAIHVFPLYYTPILVSHPTLFLHPPIIQFVPSMHLQRPTVLIIPLQLQHPSTHLQWPLPFIHHLPIIHLSPILPSSSLFSLVSPTTYKKKPISTILLIPLHPHPFKTSEKQSKEKNNSRRQQILTPPTSKKRHGAPKNNHAAHHARVLGRRQRVVRLCEVSFGGWGAPGWGRGLDGDALFGWHF